MASNTQQATSMSKGLMMYGTNGLGGLTTSTNQLVHKLILFLQFKVIW